MRVLVARHIPDFVHSPKFVAYLRENSLEVLDEPIETRGARQNREVVHDANPVSVPGTELAVLHLRVSNAIDERVRVLGRFDCIQ